MSYSRALWLICKTFHILPNDPLFQQLQPLQILWILNNIQKDAEELEKASKPLSKAEKFEMDEDTFLEFIKSFKK